MSVLEVILYLIIAGICGAIGGAIVGGTPGGFIVSVAIGFLGAYLGTWLAHLVHLPTLLTIHVGDRSFPIVWAIAGSAILVAIFDALMRPRYLRRSIV